MLIAGFFMVLKVSIFAAVAAALTALGTAPGPAGLKFIKRFAAALPAWLGACGVLGASYFYVGIRGEPPSNVPSLLIVGMLGAGGWGALTSIRTARSRPPPEQEAIEDLEP